MILRNSLQHNDKILFSYAGGKTQFEEIAVYVKIP